MRAKAHLPKTLPFLPGNTAQDPTITRHHKAQLLSVKAGTICEKTTAWSENIDPNILKSMREGLPIKLNTYIQRPATCNDAIPKLAPKWLKHDRQALKFDLYFQEPVIESRDENFRVRKCTMFYYLEDDSMYITEPKIENSGIPQGVFLKRHKFEKPDGGHYHWSDLDAGKEIEIYGRVYKITGYDRFTADFYKNEGVTLSLPEKTPDDNFYKTRFKINMKQSLADSDTQEYFEAKMNGGKPNKKLASYLENDRKVLSFKILWDDTSYDGGEKKFTMNFFLSDKTMEVKEVKVSNSGFDSFPMLLKRMQVPKTPVMTHYPRMSLRKEEHFEPSDFIIGNTINIYGRE